MILTTNGLFAQTNSILDNYTKIEIVNTLEDVREYLNWDAENGFLDDEKATEYNILLNEVLSSIEDLQDVPKLKSKENENTIK